MSEQFVPDEDFSNELCFQVYKARLETAGKEPEMEKDKMRKNAIIYKPVINQVLKVLNENWFPIPGHYIERKAKKS